MLVARLDAQAGGVQAVVRMAERLAAVLAVALLVKPGQAC
jgi:hypothetical protein